MSTRSTFLAAITREINYRRQRRNARRIAVRAARADTPRNKAEREAQRQLVAFLRSTRGDRT